MSESQKWQKCTPEQWCKAMASRLNESNARKKGLTAIVVTNFRTMEERIVGVALKTSAADPGLMLNVCPWCRESILWLKDADKGAL